MTSSDRFAGKSAIITGAASGLGQATAAQLVNEGASVIGVDVNEAGLAATAELIGNAGGAGSFRAATCDITNRDACHQVVQSVVADEGKLDVVANVAGVLRTGHVADMTEKDFDLIFGVNVAGMFWMSQAALPALCEANGSLVNVASNAGLMGQAYTVLYAASKAAVINLTRSLAMEFVRSSVRINVVAPGGIDTPLVAATAFPEDTNWKLVQRYAGFRELSKPAEIAEVVAFVASDAASAMHGAVVSADTGITAG